MNLFDKAKNTWNKISTKENQNAPKDYAYLQCPTCAGFREILLSTSYDPIQRGIESLRNILPGYPGQTKVKNYFIDFTNQQIVFHDSPYGNGNQRMQIYVLAYHVATIFPSDPNTKWLYEQIKQNKLKYVHLCVWFNSSNTGKASLFVK